jgi:protein subunit release factor B
MRELLFSVLPKDFEITWFSGKGAGGQYRNKHQNCCRVKHVESGALGTGQSQRSQSANKKEAFNNCIYSKEFQLWLQLEISRHTIDSATIDKKVKEAMKPENLHIELGAYYAD